MDAAGYLRLLRRRWPVFVGAVLAAILVAIVTAPSGSPAVAAARTFTATHTLLKAPDVSTPVDFDRLTLFATTGDVPRRAAEILGSPMEPAVLASQVQTTADAKVGSFKITVTGDDGERDAAVANAFAQAVQEFLVTSAQADRQTALAAAQQSSDSLAQAVRDLTAALQAAPPGSADAVLLEARRSAQLQRYQAAFSTLAQLQADKAARSPLQTLQEAVPVPVVSEGFAPPSSRRGRVVLAVLLALLLAAAAVIGIDRVDTRLRSRSEVEDVTRLPVLAETPLLARPERRRRVVAVRSQPGSALAEAYRTLRASLSLVPVRRISPTGASSTSPEPQVLLVTSPGPGDGKTTTVVNLAAAYAEAGRTVVVLDADVRRPAAHRHLDVAPGRGLAELVADADEDLAAVARPTNVPGVRLVTAGSPGAQPTVVLARLGHQVAAARRLADVVLVDTAPLLTASDATDLVPFVDSVLLVLRHGRTTRERAARATERLVRLGVPTSGVALIGSTDADAGGYYGNLPERSVASRLRLQRPRSHGEHAEDRRSGLLRGGVDGVGGQAGRGLAVGSTDAAAAAKARGVSTDGVPTDVTPVESSSAAGEPSASGTNRRGQADATAFQRAMQRQAQRRPLRRPRPDGS